MLPLARAECTACRRLCLLSGQLQQRLQARHLRQRCKPWQAHIGSSLTSSAILQVLASLAPTTVRLLECTRLFAPRQPTVAAAALPDAALLFACTRFLRFGAAHHPHLLLDCGGAGTAQTPRAPQRRGVAAHAPLGGGGGGGGYDEAQLLHGAPGGEDAPKGAVVAAARCLEGLAEPSVASALRPADVKRARAQLLSLVLHLGVHPLCAPGPLACPAQHRCWWVRAPAFSRPLCSSVSCSLRLRPGAGGLRGQRKVRATEKRLCDAQQRDLAVTAVDRPDPRSLLGAQVLSGGAGGGDCAGWLAARAAPAPARQRRARQRDGCAHTLTRGRTPQRCGVPGAGLNLT